MVRYKENLSTLEQFRHYSGVWQTDGQTFSHT